MPVLRTLVVLLAVAPLAWADHEVRTLGGKTVKGTVTGITAADVTVQAADGPVKTPLAQVLAIEMRPVGKLKSETGYILVRLLDDSVLRCSQVHFKGNGLSLTLLSGQAAEVPLASVIYILKEAQDTDLKPKWDKILAKKVRRDQAVVLKDGDLAALPGTFGEVNEKDKTIKFSTDGAAVDIPLDRPHGMIFFRTEAPKNAPTCVVIDTVGDSLAATDVQVKGNDFEVTTAAGARFTFPEKDLARLDYNMGKLTYLSDMEPVKIVERSGAGLITRYRRDVNLDGEPIVLANVPYAKGLSLHAHTELEYDLDSKYKDFKALVGLDTRIGGDSNALVTIECDGQKVYSKSVSAKAPEPISINVREVRRLKITVSSDNFLDLHDHATLAEARVSQ